VTDADGPYAHDYALIARVHDRLTGLYNRRKLDEILEHETNRCERFGCPATLAKILVRRVRKTDFVFRWGGEEFMVLLSETAQAEGQAIAEDIRRLVELQRWPKGIRLTASFGVCEFRSRFTPETWIEETDKRLYLAKNRGRNRAEGEA
jgi:PleD family two-component response regulator